MNKDDKSFLTDFIASQVLSACEDAKRSTNSHNEHQKVLNDINLSLTSHIASQQQINRGSEQLWKKQEVLNKELVDGINRINTHFSQGLSEIKGMITPQPDIDDMIKSNVLCLKNDLLERENSQLIEIDNNSKHKKNTQPTEDKIPIHKRAVFIGTAVGSGVIAAGLFILKLIGTITF